MAGTLFDWKGDQKQYRDRDNFRMCPQGGAISKWWEAREALWKRQWGSGSSPSLAPSFFSFFPLPTSLSLCSSSVHFAAPCNPIFPSQNRAEASASL